VRRALSGGTSKYNLAHGYNLRLPEVQHAQKRPLSYCCHQMLIEIDHRRTDVAKKKKDKRAAGKEKW